MQKDHNFTLDYIDKMYPFEYKIYYQEILNWIQEETKRIEEANRKAKR